MAKVNITVLGSGNVAGRADDRLPVRVCASTDPA